MDRRSTRIILRWDEGRIEYSSGNALEYFRRQDDKGYTFDYQTDGRKVRLNDLVERQKWVLVPVNTNFQVLYTEDGYVLPDPEVQLNLPGYNFPGLAKDELSMLAALHEVGHANLDNLLFCLLFEEAGGIKDALSLQKEVSQLRFFEFGLKPNANERSMPTLRGNYTQQLIDMNHFLETMFGFDEFKKFSEWYAWGNAFDNVKKHGLLEHYSMEAIRLFYITRLGSYGKNFKREII